MIPDSQALVGNRTFFFSPFLPEPLAKQVYTLKEHREPRDRHMEEASFPLPINGC